MGFLIGVDKLPLKFKNPKQLTKTLKYIKAKGLAAISTRFTITDMKTNRSMKQNRKPVSRHSNAGTIEL